MSRRMSTFAREVCGCLGCLAIILIGTGLAVASESSEGPPRGTIAISVVWLVIGIVNNMSR